MIHNVKTVTRDGLVSTSGKLADGTAVMYCHPHRRWEWDCDCGHVNSTRSAVCDDCGTPRTSSAQ